MSRCPHAVVLASAGTGKTYRLVEQLLRLLLSGVEPERVLATTFTRKAAGEVLDRLIRRLLAAIDEPDELGEIGALVPGHSFSRDDCIALVARLVRRPDRFQACTLDAFFVAVARLFALDLDLPPDWTIAEVIEDEAMRAEAIGRVLGTLAPDERIELLRALQRESASRSVHAALLRIVRASHEVFQESAPEAWEGLRGGHALADGEYRAFADRLAAIAPPRTKEGQPVQSWRDNLANAVEMAHACDWDGFVDLGLVKKVLAGETEFARKPIEDETRVVLAALAAHAGAKLLDRIAQETASARSLLRSFDEAYRELERERGLYRFDDIPLALGNAGTAAPLDERASELWFRLDARIDHLLFDEFQDTAPGQWRTLEPLASEVLADGTAGRSFFCVGDVKQSIYGWRKADPRLLEGLCARYPVLGAAEALVQSWRSSIAVLDTVKRVFERIGELDFFGDPDRPAWRAAAERWQARFAPCTAAKDLPGDALLIQANRLPDEKDRDAALRVAVERVVALATRSPEATIGVLVRSNAPIARLIFDLTRHGIPASGEGGNPLVDSDPVQVFLSALQLADHPRDSAAAFHVQTSPLAAALGFLPGRGRVDVSRELRARLVCEGIGPVVESLFPVVAAASAWSDWDQRRFRQLADLAHAHADRIGLRPEAFARLVRETGVEDPSASRVRVMTIHKSKGLEFDVVVLPELGATLARGDSLFVSSRRDPYGPIDRVSARPRKSLLRFAPELATLVEAVEARDLEESLCVLYVAMTRARRRLEMIVPPPPASGNASQAKSFANLLREALGAGEPDEQGIVWRHPSDDDVWDRGIEAKDHAEPPSEEPLRLKPGHQPRSTPVRSPSATEGGAPSVASLLRPIAAAAARGKLVHRWLQECEWLEDFALSDAELLALAAPYEPDDRARHSALAFLREALERPAIRSLLSKPPSGAWRVHPERAFSLPLPDETGVEELWTGSIDRLVLRHDGDHPVAAEVIDYKTDDVSPSTLARTIDFYRPQLEAYRRIAATLTGLPPTSIRARLAFLSCGEVRDL